MPSPLSNEYLQNCLRQFIQTSQKVSCLENCLAGLYLELDNHILHVTFSHPYFEDFYFHNYQGLLETAALACFGPELEFSYGQEPGLKKTKAIVKPAKDTFKDFIGSSKNQPALAAARTACAETPEKFFLLLYGPSDCGKSHLLACIKTSLVQARGEEAVLNVRAAAFAPREAPEQFWTRPRALILDDLHELNSSQQEHLASYIDAAENSPYWQRMVFSVFGKTIPSFSARLATRLKKSLSIELFQPDLSIRLAWLEKMANPDLQLTHQHLLAMARHTTQISGLAGLLQKLEFYAKMTGQILSPEELEKMSAPTDRPAAWQCIVNRVSERLAIKSSDIMGSCRRQDFVLARQIAMFLCRHKLGLSYPEIGRLFGGKDHSTVIHGIKKIEQLRQVDTDVHNLLTELENEAL